MTVFLSIGSNVRPQKNIPACVKLLKENFRVKKISSVYETKPVGPAGHKNFWNLAAAIETDLGKEELVSKLREIEKKLGRKRSRSNKFIPRTIDLDILPQKDYQKLGFIMIPLAEIAPRTRDRETGKTFGTLAKPLYQAAPPLRRIGKKTVF